MIGKELKTISVYIHWPFCKKICTYCNFNRYVKENVPFEDMEKSFLKLINDFFHKYPNKKVTSIFFGGGTPSLAKPKVFHSILNEISKYSSLENIEISMESNPTVSLKDLTKSVETKKLKEFKDAGINRLSMGIQSFDSKDLEFLGREHSSEDALKAIEIAKGIFERVSIDLIFGTKNHIDENIWYKTLDTALGLDLKHISLYQLSIEKGTKLEKDKNLKIPEEDDTYDLFKNTIDLCESKGLKQYEISNFSQKGHECQHNINYWKCRDYIGFGPGAHSRVTDENNIRKSMIQIMEPNEWMKNVLNKGNGNVKEEILNENDRILEMMLMGMRLLNQGIPIDRFKHHSNGKSFEQVLNKEKLNLFQKEGLIDMNNERLKVTKKGMFVLNQILKELV